MRFESRLRRLYRTADPADPAARDALEAELARGLPQRARPRRRWILGVTLGAAAFVGACVAPDDYDLAVGHRLLLTFDDPEGIDPHAIARRVEERHEIHELRVMAHRTEHEGPAGRVQGLRVALDVVGRLDIDEVERDLVDTFPELVDAEIQVEPLDGVVHGTVGGMLTERTLGWSLDRESVEETRARILADLAARGLDDRATVSVEESRTEQGVERKIEVRVDPER